MSRFSYSNYSAESPKLDSSSLTSASSVNLNFKTGVEVGKLAANNFSNKSVEIESLDLSNIKNLELSDNISNSNQVSFENSDAYSNSASQNLNEVYGPSLSPNFNSNSVASQSSAATNNNSQTPNISNNGNNNSGQSVVYIPGQEKWHPRNPQDNNANLPSNIDVIRQVSQTLQSQPTTSSNNTGLDGSKNIFSFSNPIFGVGLMSEDEIKEYANNYRMYDENIGVFRFVNLYDLLHLEESNLSVPEKQDVIKFIKQNHLTYKASIEYIDLIKEKKRLEMEFVSLNSLTNKEIDAIIEMYKDAGIIYEEYESALNGDGIFWELNGEVIPVSLYADDFDSDGNVNNKGKVKVRQALREAVFEYYKKSSTKAIEKRILEINNRINNELIYLTNEFYEYKKSHSFDFDSIVTNVGTYPVTDDYIEIRRALGQDIDDGKLSIFEICIKCVNSNIDLVNLASAYDVEKAVAITQILTKGFKYLNSEQFEILHYILDAKGIDEAYKYLDGIQDSINRVEAISRAKEFIEDLKDSNGKIDQKKFLIQFKTVIKGLGNGLDSWIENMSNIFSADGKPSVNDYEIAIILHYLCENNLDTLLKEYNISKSIGYSLIPTMISIFAAGSGLNGIALKVLNCAITVSNKYGEKCDDIYIDISSNTKAELINNAIQNAFYTGIMILVQSELAEHIVFTWGQEGVKKAFKASADGVRNYLSKNGIDFTTLTEQEIYEILEEIGEPVTP